MAGYRRNKDEYYPYLVRHPVEQEWRYGHGNDDEESRLFQHIHHPLHQLHRNAGYRHLSSRRPIGRTYPQSYFVERNQPLIAQPPIGYRPVNPATVWRGQHGPLQTVMHMPHERQMGRPFRQFLTRHPAPLSVHQYPEPRHMPARQHTPYPHEMRFQKPSYRPPDYNTHISLDEEVPPPIQIRPKQRDTDLQCDELNVEDEKIEEIEQAVGFQIQPSTSADEENRSESANVDKREVTEKCVSNSSKESDQNKDKSLVPGKVQAPVYFFNIAGELKVRATNIIVKLYSKLYQSYTPVKFYDCEERFIKLSKQIWEIHMSHQLTINEYTYKIVVCRQLQLLLDINRPASEYELYVTGSTLSGLSVSGSDMDICVKGDCRPGITDRHNALFHLESIKKVLELVKEITQLRLIEAKVPLLRFNVIGSRSVTVDINCNNVVAVANTQLLHAYTRCDWRLQPLCSLIKKWATFNNINDPYKKTLSSYSLALMLIQYLQCGVWPAVLPCLHNSIDSDFKWEDITDFDQMKIFKMWRVDSESQNKSSLGELLTDFFKFYSSIDFRQYVISVRVGMPIKRSQYKRINPNIYFSDTDFIIIEEPFTLNNTAYSVHCPKMFNHIVRTFNKSYGSLENDMVLDGIVS